jgi:hypothetical protein
MMIGDEKERQLVTHLLGDFGQMTTPNIPFALIIDNYAEPPNSTNQKNKRASKADCSRHEATFSLLKQDDASMTTDR